MSLRFLYSAVLPESLRWRIYHLRHGVPERLHDWRWALLPRWYVRRWTERRLDPGHGYWLFILGCNNSGTTLLAEILASHPGVRSLPQEGQHLTRAIPNSAPLGIGRVFTQRLDLFRWTEASDAACVPRLRYDWARHFSAGPGLLIEKSPPNTVRARWLQRHFRPSRFVVIVRNPYAVCEGITRRRGHSIPEAAEHWRLTHEILRHDLPELERTFQISYEQLCDRPAETLRELERFLDLDQPFDRAVVERHFTTHNMDNAPKAIENLNARSLARLEPRDIDTITAIAGEEMERFGYVPIRDTVARGLPASDTRPASAPPRR